MYRHLGKGEDEPVEEQRVQIVKEMELFKRKRVMKIVKGNIKPEMVRLI